MYKNMCVFIGNIIWLNYIGKKSIDQMKWEGKTKKWKNKINGCDWLMVDI